jgi:hypothetical protein
MTDANLVIETYAKGHSIRVTAGIVGCSRTMVRKVLDKNGIARRPRGGNNSRARPLDADRIVSLYEVEGLNAVKVARKLRISARRVTDVLNAVGVRRRRMQQPLTMKVAVEAAYLRNAQRLPWAEIVKQLGVARGTLQAAVKRLADNQISAALDSAQTSSGEAVCA